MNKQTMPLDHATGRVLHQEPTGQVKILEFEPRYTKVMAAHFGGRFLEYRRSWDRAAAFEIRPEFPLSLDLEVNAACNLKCVMCVMGGTRYVNPMAAEPVMDPALYRRLMREAETMGLPAMTFGFLSEPLLRPDLEEMIRSARQAGVMDIRLGTNGTLLTAEMSRRLIEAGLTRLEVSLDALYPETYRRIRRGGRLETVVRHILAFLENRDKAGSDFPILRLSFLRLPDNYSELDDFLGFWQDKADLFSIQEPIFFEDAPISKELEFVREPIGRNFRCPQPWQRLIVRSNGDVFPCCSIYGLAMKLGSAKTDSLARIWTTQEILDLADLHRDGRYWQNRHCRQCASRSALKVKTGKSTKREKR